jgi:hypothetical protein
MVVGASSGKVGYALASRSNLNVYLAAIIRDESIKSITTPSGDARYAVGATQLRGQTLQPDSLHLAQRNLVLCPIVELGRSRRLMPGHLLGVLEPSFVLPVNCDPGVPPGMTSNRREKTCRLGPLPNCSPGVVAVKGSSSQCCSMLERRQPECSCLLEGILNEYISIVTRASKAWISELIASAGAEVTETYIDFFTVRKGKTPV